MIVIFLMGFASNVIKQLPFYYEKRNYKREIFDINVKNVAMLVENNYNYTRYHQNRL